MTHSKVSIIIPSRGGAQRLPRLLAALRAQTVPDWEAIVVLDGDIDDSGSVVLAEASDLSVRTIAFEENRGRSAALNAGFAAATGTILARCDDDLVPGPRYVETMIREHAKEPAGLVGLYRNVYPQTPYARVYGNRRDEMFRDVAYQIPHELRWKYWAGNVSIPRSVFEKVGEYDLDFRAYGFEDVDMGYRIHKSGTPVKLVPELETPHYVAATTTEIRVRRAFHSGAARRTFEQKHGAVTLDPPAPTGLWGRSVANAGRTLDRRKFERLARLVDRGIPYTPKYISEKAIAFLVEASSLSGHSHAHDLDLSI